MNRALPSMKKEWDQRAESVRKDPEWVRFQWMSVETGNESNHRKCLFTIPLIRFNYIIPVSWSISSGSKQSNSDLEILGRHTY